MPDLTRKLWVIFVFLPISFFADFIDLEDLKQDFVLEVKKIEITGFPNAFNPSIIRWNGYYLMSFRSGNYRFPSSDEESFLDVPKEIRPTCSFQYVSSTIISGVEDNDICLVLLNENFEPIKEPQLLIIPDGSNFASIRIQDPRLIQVGDKIFLVFSNIVEGLWEKPIRRMFIAELLFDGTHFYPTFPELLCNFQGEKKQRWEKNWVPFDYQKHLLLSYNIFPHRVLQPVGNGLCEDISLSQDNILWDWGVIRGGTPAILDNGEYLGIFHSVMPMKSIHSEGKKLDHYFMGAYTFQKDPPFSVTKFSPEPIVGINFYHGQEHKTWKPLRVVFPCGMILDEKYVWVTYGRQDHEIWVVKMDKKGLLESLVPVK